LSRFDRTLRRCPANTAVMIGERVADFFA